MAKQNKTLTIKELITELQALLRQEGNKEVLLSSDPEGNSFGTIDPRYSYGVEGNCLILYPVEQSTDI